MHHDEGNCQLLNKKIKCTDMIFINLCFMIAIKNKKITKNNTL